MQWNDAKKTLLQKQSLREAYEKLDLGYEIGNRVAEARAARGLTQVELAELLDTKQPGVARLERGSYIPSLTYVQRIAEVLDVPLPQLLPSGPTKAQETSYSHEFRAKTNGASGHNVAYLPQERVDHKFLFGNVPYNI